MGVLSLLGDIPLEKGQILALASLVVGLGLVVVWFTSRSPLANEPRSLPHTLPFIGHAIPFAKNKRAFFLKAHAWNNEKPFNALIGGRKHYIFSDPVDIAAVHKNAKSLNIRGFVRFIYISIWGFKPSDADKLWDIKPEWHRVDMEWLLGVEKQDVISDKYLHKIAEQLGGMDTRLALAPNGVLELDALKTVIDVQGKATMQTLYGETTLRRHPGLLDDLSCMVGEGFWPLMFRLPRFTAREPYKSRDRLIAAFKELYEEYETRDDLSEYFVERFRYFRKEGMSGESMGSDLLRIMFASLLNSMPTGYLALLHIVKRPELLASVRQELTEAGYLTATPTELVQILPAKTPLLRSIWFETLRMHNNSLTVREVIAPTQLQGTQTWQLEQGGVVSIPCGLMHFNEALHPAPYEFHAARFLEKSLGGAGESAARTTKPFGGGSTHCPGRIFAEKQMIGLVAGLVMRYDLTLMNGEGFEVPPVSEFDDIWNRPRAKIRVTKRSDVV